jgi:hypothetical protein
MDLILLDSTSPNFNQLYNLDNPVLNSLISIEEMVKDNIEKSFKTREELKNLFNGSLNNYRKNLSKNDADKYEEFITNPNLFKTIADEFNHWKLSSENINKLSLFPDIPLTVIGNQSVLTWMVWSRMTANFS